MAVSYLAQGPVDGVRIGFLPEGLRGRPGVSVVALLNLSPRFLKKPFFSGASAGLSSARLVLYDPVLPVFGFFQSKVPPAPCAFLALAKA